MSTSSGKASGCLLIAVYNRIPMVYAGVAYSLLTNDDDIALFVSSFDVPVSLSSLCQRIVPINDRFHRAGLNKLFKGKQIIDRIARRPKEYFLATFL